jgi:regulator of chromosome condensation
LRNVVKLAAGAQHVLALTSAGSVFSWGCGEQYQLGRRRRDKHHNLVPGPCALPTGIVDLGADLYHSFAVHKNGSVYAWGSNNFGQTGILSGAGTSDATVLYPTFVKSLKRHRGIKSITAGKDHSLAITHDNNCLIWGRIDNKALGLDIAALPPDEILIDSYNRPRILTTPHSIPEVAGKAVFATAGTDHSFVITHDGEAYSWGFNGQRQAGQSGSDEVERPTLLQNKYVKGKRLVTAAAGGQFSILAGKHGDYVNDVGS